MSTEPRKPSMKGTGRGKAVPKKRERQTCVQCQKRRTQCSRSVPCAACVARGEVCDWSGAKPVIATPAFVFRNRVANDEETITSKIDAIISNCERLSRVYIMGAVTTQSGPAVQTVPVSGVPDLVTELSSITLNQAVKELRVPCARDREQFSDYSLYTETRRKVENSDRTFVSIARSVDSLQPSETGGLLDIGEGPKTVPHLMTFLPTRGQLIPFLEQHAKYLTWVHRIHHLPSFYASIAAFTRLPDEDYERDKAGRQQLHWLATLFGVLGLVMNSNSLGEEECRRASIPVTKKEQVQLGRLWIKCGLSALQLGRFTEEPSFDAIRAIGTLAEYRQFSNGETLGAGISFVSLGLRLAKALDLHRDPDELENSGNFTDLEKQDRRRVMAALFGLDRVMGSLICRNWALEPPSEYTIGDPIDCNDADFDLATGKLLRMPPKGSQTNMTGLIGRLKISRVFQEIGIAFSTPEKPPAYEEIVQFDLRLRDIEENLPESIRTRFGDVNGVATFFPPPNGGDIALAADRLGTLSVIAAAQIRLHRGFLTARDGVPLDDVAFHRQRVLYYGRITLAMERTGLYPVHHVTIQYFILSAAIALSVFCITSESEQEAEQCTRIREEIGYIRSAILPLTTTSSIIRRTHTVLGFLLEADERKMEEKRSRLVRKRAKALDRTVPTSQAAAAAVATALTSQPSDGDELVFRHKASVDGSSPAACGEDRRSAPRVFVQLPARASPPTTPPSSNDASPFDFTFAPSTMSYDSSWLDAYLDKTLGASGVCTECSEVFCLRH